MITIYPTTASALSSATYKISLPGEINPTRPRSQKITTTLDGGAAVTSWARSNAGAVQSVELTITEAVYRKLLTIVNHATVFDWVVICDGRHYICSIDMTTPVSVSLAGAQYKRASITFVVVEDKSA